MNGNPLNYIHTVSHAASACVSALDYHAVLRAGETGCGFCGFVHDSGGRLAVLMGAAHDQLLSAGLESLARDLAAESSAKPAVILRALNRSVCRVPGGDAFASMFYATLDPLRRELCYVNAGHEPALLLRRRHNRSIVLESTGAVLGLTERAGHGQRMIPLEPGDVLAVFSDGVAESVHVREVLQRSRGVRAAVLAEEILAGAARTADELAVAVVRYTGGMDESVPAEAGAERAFAAA